MYIIESFNIDKIGENLFILNKLAKAYGKESLSNYRSFDKNKQKLYYDLKNKIIKKYGKYTETHRIPPRGVADLYSIGKYTFHDYYTLYDYLVKQLPKNISDHINDAFYTNNYEPYVVMSGFSEYPSEKDPPLSFNYSGPEKYKKSEFELFKERQIVYNELLKILKFKIVIPPRDLDIKVSEEEEKEVYNFLVSVL